MDINTTQYKDNLAKLVTGVCLISVKINGEVKAMTVSSVVSVSLDPEIVSFCLKLKADSFSYFSEGSFFSINILSEDQEIYAKNGIMKGGWSVDKELTKQDERFAWVEGGLASIHCATYKIFPVGDHAIITGKVLGFGSLEDAYPLGYFDREFRKITR